MLEREDILSNLSFPKIFLKILALDNNVQLLLESNILAPLKKMLAKQADKGCKFEERIYPPTFHTVMDQFIVLQANLDKRTGKHRTLWKVFSSVI